MPLYKEPCPLPNASCSTLYSPPGSRKIPVFSRGANLPTPRRQRRFQRIFRYLRNFLEGSPTICSQKKDLQNQRQRSTKMHVGFSVPPSQSVYSQACARTPHLGQSISGNHRTLEGSHGRTGAVPGKSAYPPCRSPARLPWEHTLNTKRLAGPMRPPAVPDRQE